MIPSKIKKYRFFEPIVVLLAILLVLGLSQFWFFRIDFTKEKRYTLSDVSKTILSNLNKDIEIKVYLAGDMPSGFKRLSRSTKDMLIGLKSYSSVKLKYDFVDINEEKDAKKKERIVNDLIRQGVEPLNLSVKTDNGLEQKVLYPYAIVSCEGRIIPVKLMQNRMGLSPEEVLNNSVQNLEYALMSAIKKVSENGMPKIGVLEGHRELADNYIYDAVKTLASGYLIGRVNLNTIDEKLLYSLNVLAIFKPNTRFSQSEKYKIDQFLMHGGRLLIAIDNVNAELDSLRGAEEQLAFPKQLDIDDLLFTYGAKVNYDLMADMNCAQIPLAIGEQIQMVPWLFYPLIVPVSNHPLVKNLDAIRLEFAGSIDVLKYPKKIKKTVLLSSSPFSRKYNAPKVLSLRMVDEEPDPRAFKRKPLPVAVLLEGCFPSMYRHLPVPVDVKTNIQKINEGKMSKILLLSDGDVFKNQISGKDGSPFPLGYDRYTATEYGNKALLLNVIDYLTDDSGLLTLRNREIKIRLLDRTKIRTEKAYWQVLNVLLPILMVLLVGFFQYHYRKRNLTLKS